MKRFSITNGSLMSEAVAEREIERLVSETSNAIRAVEPSRRADLKDYTGTLLSQEIGASFSQLSNDLARLDRGKIRRDRSGQPIRMLCFLDRAAEAFAALKMRFEGFPKGWIQTNDEINQWPPKQS